ncbi:MAG: septation protein IspZ [Nanoarchaeota archaeon]
MRSSKIYPFLALLIEFGPLLLFIIMSWYFPFMLAVEGLVTSTILSLIASRLIQKRLALFPLIAGLTIIIMGLITIYTENNLFIITRDTLFNGSLALIIFYSLYNNNLILKNLFENTFAINDKGWKIVSINWAFWLLLLATSNQIIGSFYPLDFWIIFKTCSFGFSILFCLFQFVIAHKEKLPESNFLGLRKKALKR